MNKFKKEQNCDFFSNGIYELAYVGEGGEEQLFSVTTSIHNVAFSDDDDDFSSSGVAVRVFDMIAEKWRTLLKDGIQSTEQLTGEGAPSNEKKLQAGTEYMESIMEMTASDELDSMEYPEEGIE